MYNKMEIAVFVIGKCDVCPDYLVYNTVYKIIEDYCGNYL